MIALQRVTVTTILCPVYASHRKNLIILHTHFSWNFHFCSHSANEQLRNVQFKPSFYCIMFCCSTRTFHHKLYECGNVDFRKGMAFQEKQFNLNFPRIFFWKFNMNMNEDCILILPPHDHESFLKPDAINI